MKKSIVIGLGFGDEGKGSVTSYLSSLTEKPLVIRFNGGHQAGHTVVHEGKRHVFSNFGAGSLIGAPTYWSSFCTFNPNAIMNELQKLKDLCLNPVLYIDPMALVTTPYDIQINIEVNKNTKHGSCGVGFGQTIKRNEEFYKLIANDLKHPIILKEKLNLILDYYKLSRSSYETSVTYFMHVISKLIESENIKIEAPDVRIFDHLIFEGAQGVLLDMDHGFFPNVTRSNTTSKNAIELLKSFNLDFRDHELFYVTRTYQTRHGNGFMANEGIIPALKNNENETNIYNQYQGNLRISALDIDLLNYALSIDNLYSKSYNKNIVFTCMDQHYAETSIPIIKNGSLRHSSIEGILCELKEEFAMAYYSDSPEFKSIKKFTNNKVYKFSN